MLQEGIYWDSGMRPPPHFGIMFLRLTPDLPAAVAGPFVADLWAMLQRLRAGQLDDLPGVQVPPGELQVLLGFGANLFRCQGIAVPCPQDLGPHHHFRRPGPDGGPILPGAGIFYRPALPRNPATEDLVIQVTAATPLAASRAIVETAKFLADHPDPSTGLPYAELTGSFLGFNREDGRSWLDFHDGVSNLRSGQDRLDVLAIKSPPEIPDEDGWTAGGTYLAFLRLELDLAGWRSLPRDVQELVVGRAKDTGCSLVGTDAAGGPITAPGCPIGGSVLDRGNEMFREPPPPVHPVVAVSHVQRANHHNGVPLDRIDSGRIYRQGYEFLEPPLPGRAMALGLHFVSFQDSPERLFFMLTTPGWLGEINFGGVEGAPPPLSSLLSAGAAGVFLAPPWRDGEPFPGAIAFP